MKVLRRQAEDPEEGPVVIWDTHTVQCDVCKTEWVARHSLTIWRLECPGCGQFAHFCPDVPHDNLY